MNSIDLGQAQEIYTITRLNREARSLLEEHFFSLWAEGEISNFSAPQSGHWYFSLKDAGAQIRCAIFKSQNRSMILPKDGMKVLVRGRISLYEGRGDFQLLVQHIEDAGVGQLQKAFDALKKKCAAKGFFDTAHKKPLPNIPKTVGIITSPTGAAIRDILHVLKRRFPSLPVILYPTAVQGNAAAPHIVDMIQTANQRKECDILILARGGGSLEDLWPFNEEIVAEAIFQSAIPIITGVGHEIDFTIADFVADCRAPTPSAAAEIITPDTTELLATINYHQKHLFNKITRFFQQYQQHLDVLDKQLQREHPAQRLRLQSDQLNRLEIALIQLQNKLIQTKQSELTLRCAQLDALSPLAVLKRGFSIATTPKDHAIIRNSNQVQADDLIDLQLMKGIVQCKVV